MKATIILSTTLLSLTLNAQEKVIKRHYRLKQITKKKLSNKKLFKSSLPIAYNLKDQEVIEYLKVNPYPLEMT